LLHVLAEKRALEVGKDAIRFHDDRGGNQPRAVGSKPIRMRRRFPGSPKLHGAFPLDRLTGVMGDDHWSSFLRSGGVGWLESLKADY